MARDPFDVSKLQGRWGAGGAQGGRAADKHSPEHAARRTASGEYAQPVRRTGLATGVGGGVTHGNYGSESFRMRRKQEAQEESPSVQPLRIALLRATWEGFSTVRADRFDNIQIADAGQLALQLLDELKQLCTGPAMRRRLGEKTRNEAVAGLLTLIDEAVREQRVRWAARVTGEGEDAEAEAEPEPDAEREQDAAEEEAEAQAKPDEDGEGDEEDDEDDDEEEEEVEDEDEDEDEDDFVLDPPTQFVEALADLEGLLVMYLYELREA